MEKEFVSYELALELKELGFDEDCLKLYVNRSLAIRPYDESNEIINAPLYQQAFRWFREKYQLHFPIMVQDGIWHFERFSVKGFKTYEEAELECLKKLIEIVKP